MNTINNDAFECATGVHVADAISATGAKTCESFQQLGNILTMNRRI